MTVKYLAFKLPDDKVMVVWKANGAFHSIIYPLGTLFAHDDLVWIEFEEVM